MSDVDQKFRMILRGALVVLMGILAGEVFAPEPVQADECSYSHCIINDPNEVCEVSLVEETCDYDSLTQTCSTVACDEEGGPIRE